MSLYVPLFLYINKNSLYFLNSVSFMLDVSTWCFVSFLSFYELYNYHKNVFASHPS